MKYISPYLLFLFIFLLSACKKEDDNIPSEPEYVETGFLLEGEIDEITEIPLAHSTEKNDLYGVGIYNHDETSYAFGLFDDLSLAKVKLVKGERYSIRIMMVPDGKNQCLYNEEIDGYFDLFWNHYDATTKGYCRLTNQMVYSSPSQDAQFIHFGNGIGFCHYKIYSGYLPNYKVSSNDIIHVNMKRMFGAIKVIAKNIKNQQLDIEFYSYERSIVFSLTPAKTEINVFSSLWWNEPFIEVPENCTNPCGFTVYQVHEDRKIKIGDYSFQIYRNRESIIILDLAKLPIK